MTYYMRWAAIGPGLRMHIHLQASKVKGVK